MSGGSGGAEPCTDCDKARLEHTLSAEEAARAAARDLAKLEREKQLDAEETARASARELTKLATEHELALDTAEDAALTAAQQTQLDAEAELGKLFHQSISEVATGSIERSRDSAKYVQTAAAAIAALYTGVLALVFSVTDDPLPVRGVAAAVFLGLAVALATAYLAYITRAAQPPMYAGGSSLSELQLNRTGFLTTWVNAIINERRWALRASILSLAIGVAFIPAAFVATHRPPSIPEPPAAPTIPMQIAPEVADQAAKAFAAQVKSYNAAVKARNAAIVSAANATTTAADDEQWANWITLVLGIIGLIVVVGGPFVRANK
jgi:VIT1/CCC1 family predicted Fe2+/Mn2+ transporter